MDVVILLVILIAAITVATTEPSVDEMAITQIEQPASQTSSLARENDVSVCDRRDAQIIERDLTAPVKDEAVAHGK